jgi:hypothetical protein
MNRIITTVVIVTALTSAVAVKAQNTITFHNQAGEPALVKLVGPAQKEIEVPNGTKVSVDAASGRYIKVRYGTLGKYHYAKGEEFEVRETPTAHSAISITLHKVIAGNYESKPISEEEFGAIGAERSKQPGIQKQDNRVGAVQVSGLSIVPDDATSGKWPLVKVEPLPRFQGVTPSPTKKFLNLVFANDGFLLDMFFKDQNGASLQVLSNETTPGSASAVVQIDQNTTRIQYKLSKRAISP